MQKTFETTQMTIMMEEITYAKSGFGVTDEGTAVFFNSRLMENMKLKSGMVVTEHCIPNYEDKKSRIPWRCVRVSEIHAVPEDTCKHNLISWPDRIDDFMRTSDVESWTVDELAVQLGCSEIIIEDHLTDNDCYHSSPCYSWV